MWFEVIMQGQADWWWRLVSDGARTIAVSPQHYQSQAECLYAVALAMSAHAAGVRVRRPAELREEEPSPSL